MRLWLQALAAVLTATIAGGGRLSAQTAELTYRFSGWLHTSGTNLMDDTGYPVRLLSVNHSGAEWGAGVEAGAGGGPSKFGNYSVIEGRTEYQNLNRWGFNSVRLLISWANLEPAPPILSNGVVVHSWNNGYLTNLDAMISGFGQAQMSVILSLHQWTFSPVFTNEVQGIHGLGMPVWLYFDTNADSFKKVGNYQLDAGPHSRTVAEHYFFGDPGTNSPVVSSICPIILSGIPSPYSTNVGYTVQDGFIDAWKFLAGRYATNSVVVGADLYNEPPYDTAIKLGQFYRLLGSNVALINPRLLLICQDAGSQPTTLNALLAPHAAPALSNLVYSIHFYVNHWEDVYSNQILVSYQAHTYVTNYQAVSLKWNVPFWVGEYDEFDNADGTLNTNDMRIFMRYGRDNDINWSYFAYDRAAKPLVNTQGTVASNLIEVLQEGFDPPVNKIVLSQSGSGLALQWPISPLNLVLEATPVLGLPSWTPAHQTPFTNNFQNVVPLSPTNPAQFFRLVSP